MRKSMMFASALGVVLLAGPLTLSAQTPDRDRAPLPFWPRAQAELGLTEDQVTRLRGIQARLQERNGPLLEQVRAARVAARGGATLTPAERERMREEMRNATPEERQRLRTEMRERMRQNRPVRPGGARGGMQLPAELQPVVRQIRENSRVALEEARSVLTAEQRERLQQLSRQRLGQRAWGPRGPRGFRGR